MFIDEAVITVKAGDGGNGISSMRREKFIDKGGPDGGNGGNGGNVVLIAKSRYSSLAHFKYKRKYFAENGKKGGKANRFGANGEDLIVEVPLGTQVHDYQTRNLLYTLDKDEQRIVLAYGGNGGRGNASFRSSTNQAPKIFTKGSITEQVLFYIQLKLFCDIGIIGLPNAGKSTLINTITNTKSIVADYPFTTIKPVLGVLEMDYKQYFVSDIPGLIKGASENLGLGHKFLKHVEKSKVLLHLIDINSDDVKKDYKIIRNELKKYSKILDEKREFIVFSKSDLLSKEDLIAKRKQISKSFKDKPFIIISSHEKMNTNLLKQAISVFLDENK